jgi:hypothetical protein
MFNRIKIIAFWLFQMFFLFFVFFYMFQMRSLKTEFNHYVTQNIDDPNMMALFSGYLPGAMLFSAMVFIAISLILTIVSNYSISKGFKKLGVLLLLCSTFFVAFLSYADYKDRVYLERTKTEFTKLYTEVYTLSDGINKSVIEATKEHYDRYQAFPSNENKVKYLTSFETLLGKLDNIRSLKDGQYDTFANVLKLHVKYVIQYEKLLNAIQFYILICLIFLAIFRIQFKAKK